MGEQKIPQKLKENIKKIRARLIREPTPAPTQGWELLTSSLRTNHSKK